MRTTIFYAPVLLLIILLSSFHNDKKESAFTSFDDSLYCKLEESYSVVNENIIRNELYTWTTPEQIDILKKNKTLLIKSKSETAGKSNYDLLLEEKKAKGDTIAAFLLDSRFAKKRFGWPHPWATIRGYPGENYGDQLLKVTFKKDAIFCKAIVSNDEINYEFYTLDGRMMMPVLAKTLAGRIAAVYFVYSKKTKKKTALYRGSYRAASIRTVSSNYPYREYVICNENMIASWSYGTAAIKNKMKQDISFLEMVKKSLLAKEEDDGCGPAQDDFKNLSDRTDFYWSWNVNCCSYPQTIALVNSYYDLRENQLNLTIEALNNAMAAQKDSLIVKNP
ncbi:MAG: hypothetical protein JWO44_1164 [Bacteroidetes bacterium]|nr:hypothetical protein [Bacteroidota bacterium]